MSFLRNTPKIREMKLLVKQPVKSGWIDEWLAFAAMLCASTLIFELIFLGAA